MAEVAATYGDPSAFSELIFGTPMHAGQARYAESAHADVNFLLPGNSWGKTEFIARKVIYDAWFKDGVNRPTNFNEWLQQEYKMLVASYNYPIARESYDRLKSHHRNSEALQALITRMDNSDPCRIELSNGAVIDWGSLDGQGKLVEAARRRGIYVDEAGHIPDLSYTFDNILYPRTMGVSGRIHLLGTPKAHSDPYLLEVYEKGKDGTDPFYYSQSGSVLENEFWPPEEVDRLMRNPRYVRGWTPCEEPTYCTEPVHHLSQHPVLTPIGKQVILGAFIIAGGYFFNRLHVQRLFEWDGPEPDMHGDSWAFEPQPGRSYMGAFDLAGNKLRGKKKKRGSDPTVGFVVDYTERPWRIVRFDYIRGGEADWEQKYALMDEVYRAYRLPWLIIDATGNVDSVQEALQARGVEVEGVHFGGSSNKKFDMLRNLQLATEMEFGGVRGALRSPLIPQLRYELDHYVLPDDDIQQDCVFALAMVTHELMLNEVPAFATGEVF